MKILHPEHLKTAKIRKNTCVYLTLENGGQSLPSLSAAAAVGVQPCASKNVTLAFTSNY